MLARASWDTAIRPRIFSREGRRRGWAACRARDLTTDEWNVATTGSSVEAHRAMRAAEGFIGSCRWSTSKRPASSHLVTRAEVTGPKVSRATEPLYLTATGRPDDVKYAGSLSSWSAGASTDTSWPRAMKCSARSRTWN